MTTDESVGREIESAYHTLGYAIGPTALTENDCDALIAAAEALGRREGGDRLPIMNIHACLPEFLDVVGDRAVLQVIDRLVQGHAFGLQTQFFFTPPQRAGLGVHQDNYFVEAAPDSFASAWIPLVDVEAQNGALYAYPKAHRLGPLPLRPASGENTGDKRQSVHEEAVVPSDYHMVDLPMKRGQVLYIHGYCPHGSHRNMSLACRYAILSTYIRKDASFRPGRTAQRRQFPIPRGQSGYRG